MVQLNSLNKAQVMLIQSFATLDKEADSNELMDVLKFFYAKKLDEEMQRLWDNGTYDQDILNNLRQQHIRA